MASLGPATSSPGPGSSRHCPAAPTSLEGTGSPPPRGTRSRRLLVSRDSESGLSCDPVWSLGDQHPDHPAPSCVTQESPATEPHSLRSRTDHSGEQQVSPWGGPLSRQPQHLRERRSRRESADPGPHLPLPQRCPGRLRSGGQQEGGRRSAGPEPGESGCLRGWERGSRWAGKPQPAGPHRASTPTMCQTFLPCSGPCWTHPCMRSQGPPCPALQGEGPGSTQVTLGTNRPKGLGPALRPQAALEPPALRPHEHTLPC